MTNNAETFWQSVIAYRNAMDWAQEKRDESIACANEKMAVP